eukprot:ANDGO_08049.mRNA.1 hypothetical protein
MGNQSSNSSSSSLSSSDSPSSRSLVRSSPHPPPPSSAQASSHASSHPHHNRSSYGSATSAKTVLFHLCKVSLSDSLASIAVAFQVDKSALKSANRMLTDSFAHLNFLLVPGLPASAKRLAARIGTSSHCAAAAAGAFCEPSAGTEVSSLDMQMNVWIENAQRRKREHGSLSKKLKKRQEIVNEDGDGGGGGGCENEIGKEDLYKDYFLTVTQDGKLVLHAYCLRSDYLSTVDEKYQPNDGLCDFWVSCSDIESASIVQSQESLSGQFVLPPYSNYYYINSSYSSSPSNENSGSDAEEGHEQTSSKSTNPDKRKTKRKKKKCKRGILIKVKGIRAPLVAYCLDPEEVQELIMEEALDAESTLSASAPVAASAPLNSISYVQSGSPASTKRSVQRNG